MALFSIIVELSESAAAYWRRLRENDTEGVNALLATLLEAEAEGAQQALPPNLD